MDPLYRYVKERTQNLSKMFFLSGMVGNSQSRFFLSTPWGKAMTPMSSRASGPSSRNIKEDSETSMAEARLLLCCV